MVAKAHISFKANRGQMCDSYSSGAVHYSLLSHAGVSLVLTFMCELDHIAPQETTCTTMLAWGLDKT